jgi:hypothetical protein
VKPALSSNNIVLPVILLLIVLGSSCKKWLDKRQNDDLSVPTTVFDLQALLDDKARLNERVTPSMVEASADDFFMLQTQYDGLAANHSYVAPYTWDADPFNVDNDWRMCYYPVYVANLCLQQLKTIQRTDLNSREWDNVKGSAFFLRAYFFLELLWTYSKAYDQTTAESDLGIVLRLKADVNDKSARATNLQSYEQVINDAKESAKYLPDRSIHCLRPSKAAAYGLLARSYLSMREYDSALKYSNQALLIRGEIMDYNNDPDITTSFSSALSPFKKYNKETIFFSGMNSFYPVCLPDYSRIDTFLYSSYQSNDLRKKAFFRPQGANYFSFKGNYTPENDHLFTGIATDELVLIQAECLARVGGTNKVGDKDSALAVLNGLLIKRFEKNNFIPIAAFDLRETLMIIIMERRKELLMRGLRWMDLKRLNKEGANIILKRVINNTNYALPANDNRYAQPVPQEIIALSGVIQNPR